MHTNLLKGKGKDVISSNVKSLCAGGMSEKQATHLALRYATKDENRGKKLLDLYNRYTALG